MEPKIEAYMKNVRKFQSTGFFRNQTLMRPKMKIFDQNCNKYQFQRALKYNFVVIFFGMVEF